MVQLLISNGANIHVNSEEVLDEAITSKNLEILKLLLEAGVRVESNKGVAIINSSVDRGWVNLEIVKLLASYYEIRKVQKITRKQHYIAAFRTAKFYNNVEIMEFLAGKLKRKKAEFGFS